MRRGPPAGAATAEEERLVAVGDELVAGQDRRAFIPFGVDGWTVAAHGGMVHDVVVDEREIVQDFDGGRGMEGACGVAAGGFAGEQEEERPEPLPSGSEDVAHRRVERRRPAPVDQCGKPRVDVRLLLPENGLKAVQRRAFRISTMERKLTS